jgi:hypothetical protein
VVLRARSRAGARSQVARRSVTQCAGGADVLQDPAQRRAGVGELLLEEHDEQGLGAEGPGVE